MLPYHYRNCILNFFFVLKRRRRSCIYYEETSTAEALRANESFSDGVCVVVVVVGVFVCFVDFRFVVAAGDCVVTVDDDIGVCFFDVVEVALFDEDIRFR